MRTRLTLALVSVAVLSGACSGGLKRTPGAPDWFDQKAHEIKGEGYPKLNEVPTPRATPAKEVAEIEKRADTLRVEFHSADDKGTQAELPTPDEIRARAAQLRALADKAKRPGSPAPTASGAP